MCCFAASPGRVLFGSVQQSRVLYASMTRAGIGPAKFCFDHSLLACWFVHMYGACVIVPGIPYCYDAYPMQFWVADLVNFEDAEWLHHWGLHFQAVWWYACHQPGMRQ